MRPSSSTPTSSCRTPGASSNRLTIRPGIRYEQQKLVGNLRRVPVGQQLGPRIGVTYDPTGNGRNKIYGELGTLLSPSIPNDLAARALSADAGVTRGDYFDAGLTQPIPQGVLAGGGPSTSLRLALTAADFDPDSKSTYQDEMLRRVRASRRSRASTSASATSTATSAACSRTWARRRWSPISSATWSRRASSTSSPTRARTRRSPTVPRAFRTSFSRSRSTTTTPSSSRPTSDSPTAGASRPLPLVAPLRERSKGFFRNDNGQSDPAITSLFDFPTERPELRGDGPRAWLPRRHPVPGRRAARDRCPTIGRTR